MHIVIEISKPRIKPGWFRRKGVTTLRIYFLWFAISIHPMRHDEMLKGFVAGDYGWDKGGA